jgi:hypothetical protein
MQLQSALQRVWREAMVLSMFACSLLSTGMFCVVVAAAGAAAPAAAGCRRRRGRIHP